MEYKRHKLPVVIIILGIIMMLGFKDTGIFVQDYIKVNEDGTQTSFNKEENVEVIREAEESFIIVKEDKAHQIPKSAMIRTTRSSQNYRVIQNTPILDKPEGITIRTLYENELLIPEKYEGEYGIFQTSDKISGYVKLEALVIEPTESLTMGISKVDKVIKNENTYYVLAKGEIVTIKGFKDGKYTILDDKSNEFTVQDNYIELKSVREQVSRSSVSRRTQSLSKIVTSAYGELGKPYVYGDIGKKGYDCSGLTYSIYLNNLDVKLPRSSGSQINAGIKIDKSELIPGDLVFFNTTGKGISHVGLYIGDGNMIHASSGNIRKVIISTINSGYYNQRYVTARRIIR